MERKKMINQGQKRFAERKNWLPAELYGSSK
jgi:hypothetical protein